MANATHPITLAGVLDPQTSQHLPTAAAGLVFVVFALIVQRLLFADPLANVPYTGEGKRSERRKQFMQGKARQLYIDGYRKFKDSVFRVTTSLKKDNICVPATFLPELKKQPDEVISSKEAIGEIMFTKYTLLRNSDPYVHHAVKTTLTPALPRLNASISDEVAETMRLELPQTTKWTEVNIHDKLLRIVAMVSGRVFIGPELCRNEDYIDASIHYTTDLMRAVVAIGKIPAFLRPFLASRLPETRKLYKRMDAADAVFRPIITARRESATKENYQPPDDLLQWIINAQTKIGPISDRELAMCQLTASFAAIHTTTMTATNAMYWLAAKPELAPLLREDVQQALLESGGIFTSGAMQNMKKLDSFLKECMRYCPLIVSGFMRKVLKDFKLPNGQTIPAGVVMDVSAVGINNDPEIFTDPEVFDPLRFYKLREGKAHAESGTKAAELVTQAQFVSLGTNHLTFGYGRHACPGRFFAVNEIKMIMANILHNYEIRLPDGVTERYPSVLAGSMSNPDPNKTIMIRKI
ncbi:cytochrome P450 [Colletotrichum graminicola]|uniref:Cytochrome P450 n=1 Tax=Colletotrichum graminicola (strain M1.001 / M2 / FGSC 10212) TaxID=645133 RepID=E3QH57_COLGM|nr:cytochrome P450 [Colletotrichum graminicola M1.001]EFQ30219.1 cytochrome P450 [Colletotrichum graminicola M1.001]WDK09117.1 cytochrome P450 [Colletotrichum graminicola]